MRSAGTDDAPRVVVDDSSFDFSELDDGQVEEGLDHFNEALATIDYRVALSTFFWELECRHDCELVTLLCDPAASEVDRDTVRLSLQLLQKCDEWHDWAPDACTSLRVAGHEIADPYSIGFALTMAARGRGAACLQFPLNPVDDFVDVTGDVGRYSVFFFSEPLSLPRFWRHLFAFEDVTEHDFADYALPAFPELVLHPGLNFGKFEAAYRHIREDVVRVLGALNDHFARVHGECTKQGTDVSATLQAWGLDASLESPKTRGSQALMQQRRVTYEGDTYLCEWHAKIRPDRDRIHFVPPHRGPGGRILVGIFHRHLDT